MLQGSLDPSYVIQIHGMLHDCSIFILNGLATQFAKALLGEFILDPKTDQNFLTLIVSVEINFSKILRKWVLTLPLSPSSWQFHLSLAFGSSFSIHDHF